MRSKEKKGAKSNSPASFKTSQITFEDGEGEVPLTTSRPSKESKSSKGSKSKGGGSSGNVSKSSSKASSKGSKSTVGSEDGSQKVQQEKPLATSTPAVPSNEQEHVTEPDVTTIKKPGGRFVPILYTFRVPAPQPSKGVRRGSAKCPPYSLQLDHTLAVVWTLFSSEDARKPLGIAQLQWALEFLKGILNRKGEHPKDVSLCIESIQEELIQQYSDLVDGVKSIRVPCQHDLDTSKSQSAQSCSKSEDSNFMCDSDICIRKFGVDEDKSEDFITKTIPFSVNYTDMIKKSPPCLEQLYRCKRGSVCSTAAQQAKILTTGLQLDQDISRENMVGFLKNWRQEQVEKIQAELKRLRSIENFISNVDNENFTPYVDDKQLDNLMSTKTSKSHKSQKVNKSWDADSAGKRKDCKEK